MLSVLSKVKLKNIKNYSYQYIWKLFSLFWHFDWSPFTVGQKIQTVIEARDGQNGGAAKMVDRWGDPDASKCVLSASIIDRESDPVSMFRAPFCFVGFYLLVKLIYLLI